MDEFVGQYEGFKTTLQQFETWGTNVTLVRVSTDGHGPATVHWFGDWELIAAYGAFIDEGNVHEGVQEHWVNFVSPDSPADCDGTVVLTKIAEYRAPDTTDEGSASLVRIWQVKAGYDSVAQATQEQLSKHYEKFDGNSQVWRATASGPGRGNVITALKILDMTSLGGYLDETMSNVEIQKITVPFMSADPPARMLQTNIATVIAR